MNQGEDIRKVLELDDKTGRKRRRFLLLAVPLALLAAAVWYILADQRDGGANGYVTEPVGRGALTVTVVATGTIQPTNQVDVSSELSGIIRKLHVDFNSAVTVGQVLAELDTDKLRAQIEHSEAAVAATRAGVLEAQATVVERQADYRRKQRLAADHVLSQQDLETARAAYERATAAQASAEAQVLVAEAQLKIDRTNLAKSSIRSPIDGVVLKRNANVGQTVASSFQAPVLFSLADDLRQMELQVDVDEADMGQVVEGQPAGFTVDAYPDRRFPATIRQLRYASDSTAGVVTYKAVLVIDNAALLLRPGMTATAEITVQTVADTLLVPNAALRFTPPAEPEAGKSTSSSWLQMLLPRVPSFRKPSRPEDGHHRTVWTLRDGVPAAVAVRTGATDGSRTQVLDGELAVGQAVIVDRRAPPR